jgi:hypothetical protein
MLPAMLVTNLLTIAFCFAMSVVIAKRCGLHLSSALIGSMPGGFTQMVTLGEELSGVDQTAVTFMQTMRIIIVIFLVPFVAVHGIGGDTTESAQAMAGVMQQSNGETGLSYALIYLLVCGLGVYLGVKIRFPNPYLMGPLFAAACLATAGVPFISLPDWTVIVGQVLVGTHMGTKIRLSSLRGYHGLSLYTVASNVITVLFSLVIGIILAHWYSFSTATGFLSTAPGGIAEMGVTAALVGANLSVVTGFHFFRVIFIMFILAPILKWFTERYLLRGERGAA